MFVSQLFSVLEHTLLLGSQTIFVNVPRISAHVTSRSATVKGVMFSQTVWLFDCLVTTGQAMLTGDFDLTLDGIIILMPTPTIQIFC